MRKLDHEINRICKFIKDYVSKTKSNGVTIALSGGLDSAVVAALSTKAIGKDNVHCYFLRYNYRSLNTDKLHADALCKKFGLSYEENRVVSKSSKPSFFFRIIRNVSDTIIPFILHNKHLLMIFGNFEATMRYRYLNKESIKHNYLKLGTTNRSERLIGFFSKFEENRCDLQPILHLYKTEIVELAKHLRIPDEIINRVPSTDRWYGRGNEKGFTYQELDKILIELDKTGMDTQQYTINDSTEEDVSTCINLVKRAQQKHEGTFPPCLDFYQNEGSYEQ